MASATVNQMWTLETAVSVEMGIMICRILITTVVKVGKTLYNYLRIRWYNYVDVIRYALCVTLTVVNARKGFRILKDKGFRTAIKGDAF